MKTIRHLICALLCLVCALCVACSASGLHLVLNMDGIVPESNSPANGNILYLSRVSLVFGLIGFAALCGALAIVRRYGRFVRKVALVVYLFAILAAYLVFCVSN